MSEIKKGMEDFFGLGKFERKPFADGVCYFIDKRKITFN
jgi:hypothetical protein